MNRVSIRCQRSATTATAGARERVEHIEETFEEALPAFEGIAEILPKMPKYHVESIERFHTFESVKLNKEYEIDVAPQKEFSLAREIAVAELP